MAMAKELITDNRPIRLRLDLPGGFNDDMLLPQRVFGSEAICGGIEYRVLCVSANVQLPLKQMIAVSATLEFVTDRGDLRHVSGIVTEASSGDSDGGLASYQLVLRDALAILEKRTNTRVFRNMDEVEIVQRILNEWRQKSPVLGICFKHETDEAFSQRTYPKREFTMQYNESDAAFIRRLLKRRGIGWYIRADENGHTLVLFNNADSLRQNVAGTIRYHRDNATEERDTITSWSAVRSLQPGMVTRHSWDYMNPQGRDFMMMEVTSSVDQGINGNELAATLDDYQVLSPHAGDDNEDLLRLGQLRMKRHDYESKCFHGEGSVRDLCAGEYFTLAEHPEVDQHPLEERDFVVTCLQVTAQNNLPKALAARVERLFKHSRWIHSAAEQQMLEHSADKVATGPLRMHIQFTAVRRGVPIVPAFDPRVDVPQAQMQSAIVVGPKGEEVHCDQLGRVKIRFPSTRIADHEEAAGVGASDTETDSAWIRVATNWAGNGPGAMAQSGTLGLPRIGSEVLVAFLGGDPDKPVIVAQLYNEQAQPAALSKAGNLPGNRYLSGIKSREINGGRANQLRLDDTEGQISAQLASDHDESQLNLGFITGPRSHGAGPSRGEGWELATTAWGVARANKGMLITTESRAPGTKPIKDLSETLQRLNAAQNQHATLAKLAQGAKAQDAGEQGMVADVVKAQNKEIQSGAKGDFKQLGKPHLVLASPSGIETSTSGSTHVASDKHTALTTGQDLSIASGGSVFASVRQGLRMFAHKAGMRLVAAGGDIDVRALAESVSILAKLKITQTANSINISAEEEITINGGGSYAKFTQGGIEFGTGGNIVSHAAKHHFTGPKTMDMAEIQPSEQELDGAGTFHLNSHPAAGGRSNAGLPYKLYKDGALAKQGRFDDDGNMTFQHDLEAESEYQIELPNGNRFDIAANPHEEQHEVSASIGYHGYVNEGGSLTEEHVSLEQSRQRSNPVASDDDEPST
ncbi:type VI secretion system tip protein VgrG [Duganella sp. FT80W]|uniref:Type VI secretion system tip protein VgrG n=2 Tax=Duganella guangzhouensis TaxID=2666084 RepID=A0A6I2L8D6_9BURK|nr:type VI secretion system Vgr family protein [Duganella guangzhouensis]MRW94358.1 type VI secretion system tip protein VgrG [Duganella guangzhouensis]